MNGIHEVRGSIPLISTGTSEIRSQLRSACMDRDAPTTQSPSSDPWSAVAEFDKAAAKALEREQATMDCITTTALPTFLKMLMQSHGSPSPSELAEQAVGMCKPPPPQSHRKVPVKL